MTTNESLKHDGRRHAEQFLEGMIRRGVDIRTNVDADSFAEELFTGVATGYKESYILGVRAAFRELIAEHYGKRTPSAMRRRTSAATGRKSRR